MTPEEAARNLIKNADDASARGSAEAPAIVYYSFIDDLPPEESAKTIEQLSSDRIGRVIDSSFTLDRQPMLDAMHSISAVTNIEFIPTPEGEAPHLTLCTMDPGGNFQAMGSTWASRGHGTIAMNHDINDTYYHGFAIHELMHFLNAKHPHERGFAAITRDENGDLARDEDGNLLRGPSPQILAPAYQSLDFTTLSYDDGEHNRITAIEDLTQIDALWNVGKHKTRIETPMIGDIMWLHSQHGANPETGLGNTTYTLNNNAGTDYSSIQQHTEYARTIYDAGGFDTLDASEDNNRVILNLNPDFTQPSLTSSQNIFIAHETVIERAVGGSKGDSLTSHADGGSILEGRAGKDHYHVHGLENIIRDTGRSILSLHDGSSAAIEDTDPHTRDRHSFNIDFEVNSISRTQEGDLTTVTFHGKEGEESSVTLPNHSFSIENDQIEVNDSGLFNEKFRISSADISR